MSCTSFKSVNSWFSDIIVVDVDSGNLDEIRSFRNKVDEGSGEFPGDWFIVHVGNLELGIGHVAWRIYDSFYDPMVPIYSRLIVRHQLMKSCTVRVSYFNDAILWDKAWNGNEGLLFRSIGCYRWGILVVLIGCNYGLSSLLGVSGGSEISAFWVQSLC